MKIYDALLLPSKRDSCNSVLDSMPDNKPDIDVSTNTNEIKHESVVFVGNMVNAW